MIYERYDWGDAKRGGGLPDQVDQFRDRVCDRQATPRGAVAILADTLRSFIIAAANAAQGVPLARGVPARALPPAAGVIGGGLPVTLAGCGARKSRSRFR